MRLPRDVSGPRLARALARYGYQPTRQTGSHLRLTTHQNGDHHVTVPVPDVLRVGTLAGIVAEVAQHLGIDRDTLVRELFGG